MNVSTLSNRLPGHIRPEKLQDVREGAKYLLGCEIRRTLPDGQVLAVRIVETESYHQEDPASHTFRGPSPRNQAMFGPAAHAYVYFTYGMHWCFNVTAGPKGYGAGILVRAGVPLRGTAVMKHFRKQSSEKELTNGPAKLAQALAIDRSLYGHDLSTSPLEVYEPQNRDFQIVETTRIGISQAVNEIARFYISDSRFVSKP